MPNYQHRYDVLCDHFEGNSSAIEDWFIPTCLFDCFHKALGEQARFYQLSLAKLAEYIASRLSKSQLFQHDLSVIRTHRNLIQLGWYTPRGDVRFPVLLGLTMTEGDEYGIVNYVLLSNRPAMVLMPSTEDISTETVTALEHKGFLFIDLQQLVCHSELIDLAKVASAYQLFDKLHPETHAQQQAETFPTPPGARWQDIQIVFINNHTVRITCEVNGISISRVYDYTQMGMNNKRMALPNGQWELLLGFAEEHGQFTWANRQAHDKQKSHKHKLDQILKTFFGMTCSAFRLIQDDKGRVGYQALFVVLID